jgi:hypothetical protein
VPTDASIAPGLPWLADRSAQSRWLVASCGMRHRERALRFAERLGRPAATGSELFALPRDWGDLLRSELQRQREGHKSRRLWGGIRRSCDPSWRAAHRGRSSADAQGILDGRCEKRGDVVESRLTNRRSRACVPAVVARHADMSIPLPTTKSYHLAQHRNLVSRPRRIERLNVGCHRRLQLVSPPFGSNNSNPQNEPLPCTRRTVSCLSGYASEHQRSAY